MKISVAICTYNGEKYIKEQIDSILNQSLNVDEIIVCDDLSTDDTIEILSQYKDLYPLIFSLYVNDKNLGSTKNFEKAIKFCTGDYIFLSDQDDIWKHDKTEKTLAIFKTNPKAEAVFSNAELIDSNGQLVSNNTIWDSVFFFEKELPKPIDFFNLIAKNGNVVTGATLCFKNTVRDLILPFTEDVLHDEKIATVFGLRKTLFYVTENLISYRLHDNQQVGMKNFNKIDKKNRIKRIFLDLEKPQTFNEHRELAKKKYLKYKKAVKTKDLSCFDKESSMLIEKSLREYLSFNLMIKKQYPFRFVFFEVIDLILGKRNI